MLILPLLLHCRHTPLFAIILPLSLRLRYYADITLIADAALPPFSR